MTPHNFAKLTHRQKLEHITKAKRVTAKEVTTIDNKKGNISTGWMARIKGILIGSKHKTSKEAIEAGKALLKKYKSEAKELGIPTN